ncbi:hypothetical protein [Staphylococcus shinii]|uniref:hypothetical protein n=1 Tax=Staphylococcus shinii TaxID=2912228 RepID=UPI003CF71E03
MAFVYYHDIPLSNSVKPIKTQYINLLILYIEGVLLLHYSLKIPILGLIPFILWGAMGWATQAPQQHILLKNHSEHGSTSVALNSSLNYLGSAIGAALGGLLLAQGASTNILIYSSFAIVIIGVIVQLINVFIDRDGIKL